MTAAAVAIVVGTVASGGMAAPIAGSLGAFLAKAAFAAVSGAVTGYAVTSMSQYVATKDYDVGGALKAAAISAAIAVAAAVIGHAPGLQQLWDASPALVEGVKLTDVTLKPLLHGAAQGGISAASGGDFMQGFYSGAFSSFTGPIISSIGGTDQLTFLDMLARGLAGAAAGVGGAYLKGDDLVMGGIQGAFIQMFNDWQEWTYRPYQGQVRNPIQALLHYIGGTGETLKTPFEEIDLSVVKLNQFNAIQKALADSSIVDTVAIDDTHAFKTRGSHEYYLGNITFRITGKLNINRAEDSWSFDGTISALRDFYDFNASTHRDKSGETSTTMGRQIPGTPYYIEFDGSKPISGNGKLGNKK